VGNLPRFFSAIGLNQCIPGLATQELAQEQAKEEALQAAATAQLARLQKPRQGIFVSLC
jgi:hypothetical protein